MDTTQTARWGLLGRMTAQPGKRDELVARAKAAQAQRQVQETIGSINVMDPTSDLSRWEDAVRREEAQAAGHAEIAASSFESQFDALEAEGDLTEIELRLEALKNPTPAIGTGDIQDQITSS